MQIARVASPASCFSITCRHRKNARSRYEAIEDFPGTKKPWRCRCTVCGTVGTPQLGGIKAGQGGCVPCGQAKTAAAARGRRLDDDSTAGEMRAAGLEPLVPYPGSDKQWSCRCMKCERTVFARLTGVRTGKGCRFCATHGIDLTAPTMVYVITHERWGSVKDGIGACTGYNSRGQNRTHHARSAVSIPAQRRQRDANADRSYFSRDSYVVSPPMTAQSRPC